MPGPSILKYGVNSEFGDPDTVEGRRSGPHRGTDFLTPENTKLESPINGIVVDAGNNAELGRYVTIKGADGTLTYAHGSRVPVRKGQQVRAGDIVFISGNTGASTGPHTHAEWTTATGERIDPVPIFRKMSLSGRTTPGPAAPLTEDPDFGPGEEDPTPEDEIDLGIEEGDGSAADKLFRALGFIRSIGNRGGLSQYASTPEQVGPSYGRALFATPNRSDTAENILKSFGGYGGVSSVDAEYSLPFYDQQLGGSDRAVRNILRSLGHDPVFSNPYTQFMERKMGDMVAPVLASAAASGQQIDQRSLAEGIVSLLQQGQNVDSGELAGKLGALPRNIDELNQPQSVLLQLLGDPAFAKGLYQDMSGLQGSLRSAAGRAYDVGQEQFMNQATGGGASYLDFIQKYLR